MADKEKIIIDGVDVSECAIYRSSQTRTLCCSGIYCKEQQFYNCYFKQLKRKEQECEDLKEKNALLESQMAFNLNEVEIRLGNEVNRSETLLKELKRLDKIKDEYREMSENLKAEEKFLKQCCQKAGEELAKHSFDYDGKEKNLVVQAMELNEKYEKLSILAQEESARNGWIEYELNDRLKQKTQECELLSENLKIKEDEARHYLDETYKYRKALAEIEEYVNSQLDGFGNDVYAMDKVAINEILTIINKAKRERDE